MLALASLSLALAAVGRAAAESSAAFRIIVNPDNKIAAVSREFLADAFLRNVQQWGDGQAIAPVDLAPSASTREDFSRQILLRSVAAVRSYWQQRIFTGRGVPPPELDSDGAVIRYVGAHRGAVGYVSRNADVAGLRVVPVQ
jgi:hypothetical protein